MHIGFISTEYPQLTALSGGLGTSLKNLAEAFIKNDIRVSVFIFNSNKELQVSENGIDFYFIKKKIFLAGTWYFNRKHFQKAVQKIAGRVAIDLIEAPDWTGITAFMKFKVPLVIRLHGSDSFFCYLEKRKQKLKNFLFEELAVKGSDGIISPTVFAAKTSAQLFGLAEKKIRVIHYGLPLNKFINKDPLTIEKGLILYYGSLIRKKGVFELPGIFKAVLKRWPGARLILIGNDCPDRLTGRASTWKLLQDQIAGELKQKVTYLSAIPYNHVQSYIQKAHVCIFPSFAETLGMVTIESMAMRKGVVTSDFGWSREIIDDGVDGYLANPNDHQAFAKKITALLDDRNLLKRMGDNAAEKVHRRFDVQQKVAENIEYYREIIRSV